MLFNETRLRTLTAPRVCSVEGCGKPRKGRGYCSTHYYRLLNGLDLYAPIGVRPERPTCSVDGCDKGAIARGWCNTHYSRWHAHGHLEVTRTYWAGKTCAIAGCRSPVRARGWCGAHHSRWRRFGDPEGKSVKKIWVDWMPSGRGAENANWTGDSATYGAAHQRVRKERGAAANFLCPCGSRAREWAYQGGDPGEKFGPNKSGGTWSFYSTDPNFYEPLCAPCHKTKDGALLAGELREWREIRYLTKLTGREIREKLGV